MQKGGRPSGWSQLFLQAFSTTLREGIESVIFLTGVSAGIDPRSIPIAGIVGIMLGLAVGIILYYTCASVPFCLFLPRSAASLHALAKMQASWEPC